MFQTSKEQIIKFCDTIEMPIIYIILLLKWKEEFICQKKKVGNGPGEKKISRQPFDLQSMPTGRPPP